MCLPAGTYYAVVTLVDAVGNEIESYLKIVISGDGSTGDCDIDVYECHQTGPPECIIWDSFTSDTIGDYSRD